MGMNLIGIRVYPPGVARQKGRSNYGRRRFYTKKSIFLPIMFILCLFTILEISFEKRVFIRLKAGNKGILL